MTFVKGLHEAKEDTAAFQQLIESCLLLAVPLVHVAQSGILRITDFVDLCLLTGQLKPCSKILHDVLKLKAKVPAEGRFRTIYIPLISPLKETLRKRGVPITQSPFSEFMHLIIGQYLADVLGPKPPADAQAKVPKVGCGCLDCHDLNPFLASERHSEISFSMIQSRRTHLERRLSTVREMVICTTLRHRSPHVLQVKKNPALTALNQWATRQKEALAFISSIGDGGVVKSLMKGREEDMRNALEGRQKFVLRGNITAAAGSAQEGRNPSGPLLQSVVGTGSEGVAVTLPLTVRREGNITRSIPSTQPEDHLGGNKRKAPSAPLLKPSLGFIDLTDD